MRVLTWNLWWRFGPWQQRAPAIAATVGAARADIVCLQEVWIEDGDSSARQLADHLGFHHVETSRIEMEGVGFGNAVLSRWPISSHEMAPLPSPEDLEEFRTVLRADIDGPRGPLQAFSTHLHWRLDHSAIRQDQVRAICRFVAGSPERSFPAVVCGDFNAEPDSDEIRMMVGKTTVPEDKLVFFDAWNHAGDGPGLTWDNANPFAATALDRNCRLDYIFVGYPKQGGRGHVTSAQLVGTEPVDGMWPSDHYGVAADLRY
ncbi:MAG: endonuclease/exonuclease/phosphatase family protein [Acidimicrobiia bacterium]|nr:endonuclease/exonuclease/phosphatase family protein [Acidimicrobiia bacterium]